MLSRLRTQDIDTRADARLIARAMRSLLQLGVLPQLFQVVQKLLLSHTQVFTTGYMLLVSLVTMRFTTSLLS